MSNHNTGKQVTRNGAAEQDQQQRAVLPAVDVFEDASGITLLADMPGVSKEDLELKVEGEALLIEGGMQQRMPEGLEAIYAEVRVPRFRRSFTLSRELDTTRIEANLKDGVLNLRIPKQAHAQPRRIPVNAG
jgi:HSP20 family protein